MPTKPNPGSAMGEAKRKADLLKRCAKEMREFNHPIILQLDITSAMVFCGALQLALRHPGFAGRPSAKACQQIVDQLALSIPEQFEGLKELIRLGGDPYFDS